MKTHKIGDYIQISKTTRLYIDDIQIDIEGSETTIWIYCSEIHKSGIGSGRLPYTLNQFQKIIKQ